MNTAETVDQLLNNELTVDEALARAPRKNREMPFGRGFEYGMITPKGRMVHGGYSDMGHMGIAARLGYGSPIEPSAAGTADAIKAGHVRWWVSREPGRYDHPDNSPMHVAVEYDDQHPKAPKNADRFVRHMKGLFKASSSRQNTYRLR